MGRLMEKAEVDAVLGPYVEGLSCEICGDEIGFGDFYYETVGRDLSVPVVLSCVPCFSKNSVTGDEGVA